MSSACGRWLAGSPQNDSTREAWSTLFAGAGYELVEIVGDSTDLFWVPQVCDLGACIAARLGP